MQVSRQHVLDILRYAELAPEDEQKILALPYPADLDRVIEVFSAAGVSLDWLISRLGGSP